jgi:hypothetical protein
MLCRCANPSVSPAETIPAYQLPLTVSVEVTDDINLPLQLSPAILPLCYCPRPIFDSSDRIRHSRTSILFDLQQVPSSRESSQLLHQLCDAYQE